MFNLKTIVLSEKRDSLTMGNFLNMEEDITFPSSGSYSSGYCITRDIMEVGNFLIDAF